VVVAVLVVVRVAVIRLVVEELGRAMDLAVGAVLVTVVPVGRVFSVLGRVGLTVAGSDSDLEGAVGVFFTVVMRTGGVVRVEREVRAVVVKVRDLGVGLAANEDGVVLVGDMRGEEVVVLGVDRADSGVLVVEATVGFEVLVADLGGLRLGLPADLGALRLGLPAEEEAGTPMGAVVGRARALPVVLEAVVVFTAPVVTCMVVDGLFVLERIGPLVVGPPIAFIPGRVIAPTGCRAVFAESVFPIADVCPVVVAVFFVIFTFLSALSSAFFALLIADAPTAIVPVATGATSVVEVSSVRFGPGCASSSMSSVSMGAVSSVCSWGAGVALSSGLLGVSNSSISCVSGRSLASDSSWGAGVAVSSGLLGVSNSSISCVSGRSLASDSG